MNRQEIIDYCLSLPAAYEDYPFDSFATSTSWTVMRHRANQKTFAMIYQRGGRLCVNLKCEVDEADFLRQVYADIAPGYHMNKAHWNTITVGGDVPDEEIKRQIRESYALIRPKKGPPRRAAADGG